MVNVTKHNTPALRFAGFDGEWGTPSLGDLGVPVSGVGFPHSEQGGETGTPFFKVSDMSQSANERELLFAANYVSAEQVRKRGWQVVNGPAVVFAKVGAAVLLDRKRLARKQFLADNNMMAFVLTQTALRPDFALSLFGTLRLSSLVQVGALPSINGSQVKAMQVSIPPSHEEQRAIGELFSNLDALIEQHRAKHANLQQTKTALVQRMFPQDGADEPELRLGGFSGAWEIQPFSDLVAYRGHNSLSRADLTNVPTSAMNIHYGDILVKYDSVVDVSQTDIPFVRDVERLSNLSRQSLSDGDILFADAAEDSTVGKCVEVQGISDNLVLAGLHTISARPIRTFAPGFLGHALNAPSFHNQLLSKMQGTKVSSISISTLAETVFSFPTPEEQRAIGEVFTNLDALIAAESHYITQLTQAKTALLQRIFV